MKILKCKTFCIYLVLIIAICAEMTAIGYSALSCQYWVALGCVVGAFQCGRFDERAANEKKWKKETVAETANITNLWHKMNLCATTKTARVMDYRQLMMIAARNLRKEREIRMAKFNIEVELDWLNDEEYSIDDEIREQVINGVKDKLLKRATDEALKKLDSAIAEKLEEATEIIEQRVQDFIAVVTEKQIEKIKIPKKKSTWSDEVDFIPISEFVGKQYEEYLTKKVYDKDFEVARYNSDKVYSIAEAHIKSYLNDTLSAQVSEMVRKAQKEAEDTVIKTLEQNLKDQLAVDTIKRMNIPKLLENLQQKALEFEKEGADERNN